MCASLILIAKYSLVILIVTFYLLCYNSFSLHLRSQGHSRERPRLVLAVRYITTLVYGVCLLSTLWPREAIYTVRRPTRRNQTQLNRPLSSQVVSNMSATE